MLKASPSGADKIQSFPDLRQILLYAALGGIVLAALFAPWLTDVSPLDQDLMNLDQPFSPAHPLGTDSLGRDILARLVYGARTTLEISLGGTFIAFFIGAGIGLTALSMGRFAAGVFFAFIDLVRALITQLGIVLPRCIVTESVLSFLGLGSSPDEPTWGRMIADAAPMMERAPHEVIVPLCALVLLTFSLSLLANEWRERLDPIRRLERC
ncbi:ABC transporter permease [Sutterella wadsworthensis]|uniref:ABC transporter permease n=1 Tax=Sutterella wadsworthensis TaxID=40545 RepID=UPI00307FB73C